MQTLSAGSARRSPIATPRLGRLGTVPNYVTLVRTVVAVAVGLYAVSVDQTVLLAVAYAVYWVGDIADGWLARKLDQETRLGAVLDIVSDRACTAVLCVGLVAHLPSAASVATVFLLSFMVLDTMLSLAFLCWPVQSPNDFGVVDQTVYAWNWSPPAKAANTAGVVAAVLLGYTGLALALATAVAAVKVWSAHRVLALLTAEDR